MIVFKLGWIEEINPALNVVQVELVSKELHHMAAILHVYAKGLNFMK